MFKLYAQGPCGSPVEKSQVPEQPAQDCGHRGRPRVISRWEACLGLPELHHDPTGFLLQAGSYIIKKPPVTQQRRCISNPAAWRHCPFSAESQTQWENIKYKMAFRASFPNKLSQRRIFYLKRRHHDTITCLRPLLMDFFSSLPPSFLPFFSLPLSPFLLSFFFGCGEQQPEHDNTVISLRPLLMNFISFLPSFLPFWL